MDSKLVFLPEADDDFQEIVGQDKALLIRSIRCYVLLSDGIILHPAYIWQSKITNEVVLEYIEKELLTPKIFKIVLGDSDTIKEYIKQRVSKLSPRRLKQTLYEYYQYKRWGKEIFEQAGRLDEIFSNSDPVMLAESRDKKFRDLLKGDISENIDPHSLYARLSDFLQTESVPDKEKTLSRIRGYIESSELVSVESFTNYVANDLGLERLARTQDFRKRMLDIYYHANVDERISVPGLKIVGTRFSDPFDADVFWQIFGKVFGAEAANLLTKNPDSRLTKMVLELRDSTAWQSFRRIYFSVLEEIEAALWQNMSSVREKIEDESGYSTVKLLRRIWREKKLEIAGAIFGLGSLVGGPIPAVVVGLAAFSLSAYRLIQATERYLYEFHRNELTILKHEIPQLVQSAVKERYRVVQDS